MARKRSKGPSVSGDFRRIYNRYPSWIHDTSNARVLDRYRQDKGLAEGAPVDKKIMANLANLKSLLRKKERDTGGTKLVTTKPGVRGAQRLDLLEELIDDAMGLAKTIDREGLSKVLSHLRAARNTVVMQGG